MPGLRRCRWCQHPLGPASTPAPSGRLRAGHCDQPACDWCQPCVARRSAAIAAGRQDLLEAVAPVPPETACEQTREIPAVRDEIPPDQMT
jgi:hypothetical protein